MKRIVSIVFILFVVLGISFNSCSKKPPNKIFHIARDLTYPLNLYGRENNMVGFIDELISAVAAEKGLQIQLVSEDSNTFLSGIDRGAFEAAVTALLPGEVSGDYYLFSDPLYLLGFVLVIPEKSEIKSVEQLQGKTIGVERGSAAAFDIIRYPTIFVRPYESSSIALDNLAKNEIDGVLMPVIPAYTLIQGTYHGRIKIATHPLTNLGFRLIARNESVEKNFISLFNQGLEIIRENGTYDQLCQKWNLHNPESVKTTLSAPTQR